MKTSEPAATTGEIERIRSEYARRRQVIPRGFYGLDRPANLFAHCQLLRSIIYFLTEARAFPLDKRTIGDIGCGRGSWLLQWMQLGADPRNLYGIDIEEAPLVEACKRIPEGHITLGDAQCLPWPDASLDIVTQLTVFTSILCSQVKRQIAQEMMRVVKNDGVVIWYDFVFNNPKNPNVRGITVAELRDLFPTCCVTAQRVTLAPPVARIVTPFSWVAGQLLETIPFMRTHCLAVIRKAQQTGA